MSMMDVEQIELRVKLYRDRYPREVDNFEKARKLMEQMPREQLMLILENMWYELIQKREVRNQAIAVLRQDIQDHP